MLISPLKDTLAVSVNTLNATYKQLDPRYFDNEIKSLDDNPTIGIILCTDKKDTIVKYSILNGNKNLYASKYQLYLPTEEEFINEIEKTKDNI